MLSGLCVGLNNEQKREVVKTYLKEAEKYSGNGFEQKDVANLLYDVNNMGKLYYCLRELGGLGKAILARPNQKHTSEIQYYISYLTASV